MKTLLLTLFIANALFWGLFPHNAHCLFLDNVNKILKTNIRCPPHHIHLFMGIFFYLASIYISQKDSKEFKSLMPGLSM
tara:strand:+ start:358 stop:594 length:237 start_codon:yes stop_codon:yes gene_type:complete